MARTTKRTTRVAKEKTWGGEIWQGDDDDDGRKGGRDFVVVVVVYPDPYSLAFPLPVFVPNETNGRGRCLDADRGAKGAGIGRLKIKIGLVILTLERGE